MKTLFSILTLASTLIMFLPKVSAAEVEVIWQNPDKYRDVDAGNNHQEKFRKNTFSRLEQHLNKLAEKLPKDYRLIMIVSDLDLAGDVHHGGVDQIRIVKDIFYPRMKFSYQLLSAQQKVLSESEVVLKDMNFLMNISNKYKNSTLSFEKSMLDDWFKDAFSEHIVK